MCALLLQRDGSRLCTWASGFQKHLRGKEKRKSQSLLVKQLQVFSGINWGQLDLGTNNWITFYLYLILSSFILLASELWSVKYKADLETIQPESIAWLLVPHKNWQLTMKLTTMNSGQKQTPQQDICVMLQQKWDINQFISLTDKSVLMFISRTWLWQWLMAVQPPPSLCNMCNLR